MTDPMQNFEAAFAAKKPGAKSAPKGQRQANGRDDAPPKIALTFFRELAVKPTPKLWLIKNVIARGEVSSWIGKPGGGKSALLTDLCVYGGQGQDWRGYRTPQPFGTVYFALERADLVKRRMQAHRLRDELPADLPIAVAGQIISLIDPGSVAAIVDAINRAQDDFRREVGLAIFDTRSKGIAAGGGDEDKARFQNLAAAHLRRVIERTGIHIASIGHTGKDASRGERGSNATLGDVDVEVTISGDAVRTADVTKANDQPLGRLTGYELEPYEFALDPDDEDEQPHRTWIVAQETRDDAMSLQPRPAQALNDKQRLALEALTEVLLSAGQRAPAEYKLPGTTRIVASTTWKTEIFRRDIFNGSKNPHSRFGEMQTALQARHLIGVRDGWVWDARS